eukprot:Blabericola_migrator_1__2945@NODE_184_length_11839_cov_88_277438_g159_i0_p4_GENE_NODE_184_length_11839_cov_88_277438_g159_i0NODE_184_length_11839_cov_88_277438_g159_i0_p4_ORF_typecomplete_len429_score56_88YfhO/PF09586_10/0_081Colicin_V/PF02674_16/1_2e02Colicin_V/PF02674_16/4_2_NODE_184_length_11839_cov_88_277438_g159_i030664352
MHLKHDFEKNPSRQMTEKNPLIRKRPPDSISPDLSVGPLEKERLLKTTAELYRQCRALCLPYIVGHQDRWVLPAMLKTVFWISWTMLHIIVFYLLFLISWLWLSGADFMHSIQSSYDVVVNDRENARVHFVIFLITAFLAYKGWQRGSWDQVIRGTLRSGIVIMLVAIPLNALIGAFISSWGTLNDAFAMLGAYTELSSRVDQTSRIFAEQMREAFVRRWYGAAWMWGVPQNMSEGVSPTPAPKSFLAPQNWAWLGQIRCLRRATLVLEATVVAVYTPLVARILLIEFLSLLLSPILADSRLERHDIHFSPITMPLLARIFVTGAPSTLDKALNGTKTYMYTVSIVPFQNRLPYWILGSLSQALSQHPDETCLRYCGVKLGMIKANLERRVQLEFHSKKNFGGEGKVEFTLRHHGVVKGSAVLRSGRG